MTLDVNGAPREFVEAITLDAMIDEVLGTSRGTAAVVDGTVVPRSEWAALALHDGQHIELITAVQGG